jgi:hypothetical protein
MRHSLLTTLFIIGSSACATITPNADTKAYMPPSLMVPAIRSDLFAGVRDMVDQEGWTVVSSNPSTSIIEAVTPADSSLGVEIRERWLFVIEDYQVSAKRTLEVRFDPSSQTWEHEGAVCSGYIYLRENEVLSSIERRFDINTSIAANQLKAKTGS